MRALASHAILIVEDERIVAKDLQYMLVAMGYDAYAIAASADEAIARATERCPDLVLMDIRIKGSRDGIETAEVLRRQSGVPVVYLTSHSDDTTLDRATRTNPYGYLMKPLKAAELRSAIEISIHRHAMEKQLRERERWFATTLRSISDAVVTADPEGRIASMNPAAERLTGLDAERAIGSPAARALRLTDPVQPPSPLDAALALRRGVAIHDAAFATSGEATGTLAGSAAPVVDGGELLGAVMVVRDVTDQARLQRQLEIADRLASLGTLTSGVAHQINNPLAVVLANASYLRGELDDIAEALDALGEPGRELAVRLQELSQVHNEVSTAGWRIGKIVADLKAFSRPAEATPGSADVARAIAWAVRTTEHEFRNCARLSHRAAAVPLAIADEGRLGQVFVNLLMNAAQAIPPGNANRNEVAIEARAEADRVVVEIRDTGPGIPPEDLRRIFEPFYTTRAIGQGTGLGLSVCHGIVTSFGGELQVESRIGAGTAFRVVLRSAAARPAAAPSPAPAAAPVMSGRRARILVVDDDAMVHRAIARLLRGHDLVCADGARDALARIDRGERYDVMLTDLMMPVMTGIELYEQLAARDLAHARRVVFMTGGAVTTGKVADFLRTAGNLTLEKPFGMAEVHAIVNRALAEAEPPASDPRAASADA